MLIKMIFFKHEIIKSKQYICYMQLKMTITNCQYKSYTCTGK